MLILMRLWLILKNREGHVDHGRAQMNVFKNTLENCGLSDMGFTVSRFTWSNKKTDAMFTKERLDRVVATIGFASKFSQLIVEVLAARTSDHTHLYVSLHDLNGRQRTYSQAAISS